MNNSKLPIYCSMGGTRTPDLQIMSLARYHLLHPAMYFLGFTHESTAIANVKSLKSLCRNTPQLKVGAYLTHSSTPIKFGLDLQPLPFYFGWSLLSTPISLWLQKAIFV